MLNFNIINFQVLYNKRDESNMYSRIQTLFLLFLLFACEDSKKENHQDPSSDQSTIDQATTDQAIADQANVDQATVDQIISDQATVDQAIELDANVTDMQMGGGSILDRFKLVPGPLPETFDCTSNFEVPARLSPVPLNCIIDPNCQEKMVIAHRGAGGDLGHVAPENTLFAIRAALLMGVDGVELDVRHTSDGKLVLMHDGDVNRTTDGEGNVSDLTLEQLKSLKIEAPTNLVKGDFSCANIPTLQEAFELTKDRLIIILDMKSSQTEWIVRAVQDAQLQDQVILSFGNFEEALLARMIAPEMRVQVRPDTVAQFDDYLSRLMRPADVQEIPHTLASELSSRIHMLGVKAFSDVWHADLMASLNGDSSIYLEDLENGLDVIQCELVTHALTALGRWDGENRRVRATK
jgi:glycerophosphoryl diester phosphodiesterase